jgi:hypothetical protein
MRRVLGFSLSFAILLVMAPAVLAGPPGVVAPEIDPSVMVSAVTLLTGSVMMLTSKRRQK